jgi:hypothetical protein
MCQALNIYEDLECSALQSICQKRKNKNVPRDILELYIHVA